MCKVARIIHFTDQMGSGSQPTGRIDFIIAVMSDLKFCIVNILRFFRCVQINENFIQMQSTDFLVSVPAEIIGGIDNADSGYININGDKLEDMSEKKLTQYRRKHLGYVFQMYNLIANLNVKENIEVGAYLSDNALDIDDLLHTLGLYEHRYKLPNQLSGGQQQRVSIGRAIVKNPDILLCDEPTGALDYNTSKEILKLIEDVNKKYGNTIIMVTHNEAIKNMADHVIKLRDGAVRHNDINTNKISADELEW